MVKILNCSENLALFDVEFGEEALYDKVSQLATIKLELRQSVTN